MNHTLYSDLFSKLEMDSPVNLLSQFPPPTASPLSAEFCPSPKISISTLPPELRLQIYREYFHSLDALRVSTSSSSSTTTSSSSRVSQREKKGEIALLQAAQWFEEDIPDRLVHENIMWEFDDGDVMREFVGLGENGVAAKRGENMSLEDEEMVEENERKRLREHRRKWVRRVRISFPDLQERGLKEVLQPNTTQNGNDKLRRKERDWVFLLHECFQSLEEVEFQFPNHETFQIEMGMGLGATSAFASVFGLSNGGVDEEWWESSIFENWWDAVVDALREGRRRLEGSEGRVRGGLKIRCVLQNAICEGDDRGESVECVC